MKKPTYKRLNRAVNKTWGLRYRAGSIESTYLIQKEWMARWGIKRVSDLQDQEVSA